jgi:hypothetical protein
MNFKHTHTQLCGLAGADIAWVTDLYIKMSSFHIHQLVRRILMRPCATPVRLNYHFYQLKDAHALGNRFSGHGVIHTMKTQHTVTGGIN